MRPEAPHEGLDGHVEEPDEDGDEKRHARAHDEDADLLAPQPQVMRGRRPLHEAEDEDGEGEAHASGPVGSSGGEVAPRQDEGGHDQEHEEQGQQDLGRLEGRQRSGRALARSGRVQGATG